MIDLWVKEMARALERDTVFDQLMVRDRMREATIAAIGAWRAEPLFPAHKSTIRVRLPNRYHRSDGPHGYWAA